MHQSTKHEGGTLLQLGGEGELGSSKMISPITEKQWHPRSANTVIQYKDIARSACYQEQVLIQDTTTHNNWRANAAVI